MSTPDGDPPPGEALLAARGLALGYGGAPVLRDVTLTIGRGDYWFLLGPNGSGKTTLLRALLGVLPPRAGALARHPLAAPAHVGFVPQRAALNPTLPTTVGEVVRLGLVGVPVARAERPARLDEALAHVGLGGMAARDFWALSGGQQQRALVARALVRRPRLLVLDEPMSGLDLVAEDRLLPLIAAWNRERGLTVLYVTHEIALARRYATHVCLFARGTVIAGRRDEVVVPANLAAAYGVAVDDEAEPADAGGEAPG
jgi:ABC-type Mn2+/Zn2+ transport system ATPase subunit